MRTGRLGFRARLILVNVAVIALGSAVVFAGVGFIAPGLFDSAMSDTMGSGAMGMGAAMNSLVRSSFQSAVSTSLLLATAIASVAAVLLSAALSSQVARPIRDLDEASQRIAAGRYGERVEGGADDEIGRLARSFNRMAASLQATDRRRTELVGDVAHELRTPLTTLDGYLEGLEDGVVAAAPETWAVLRRETSRLRRLVDDLQELWRAEAGQLPLRPQDLPAASILEAAADRFGALARERGIALQVDASTGLPAVRADRDRASQIVDNYISNALRYGPSESTVELGARRDGAGVVLSVTDHGPGLTADQLDQVFERFYRVDPSRTRALGGAGIGLAVARALAEAMDGRAWATSPGPGAGSTFSVWLPAAKGSDAVLRGPGGSPRVSGSNSPPRA